MVMSLKLVLVINLLIVLLRLKANKRMKRKWNVKHNKTKL